MVQAQPSAGSGAVLKKPTAEQVVKLVRKLEGYTQDQKDIGVTAREHFDKAVETQHFDKKALSWVRPMYRMAKKHPEAFAVTLPHLLAYIDDLGLAQMADDRPGLPLDSSDESPEDDGGETGGDFAETPASGKSPDLTIVPRPDEELLSKVGHG